MELFERPRVRWAPVLVVLATFAICTSSGAQTCSRTITANVVALDQVFFWNRLGTVQPQGMIFALRRDVVPLSGLGLVAGNVQLRPDKRPRPIVLRMNVGDCLQINFQNLLNAAPVDQEQPATRTASVNVVGLQLVGSIASDGSNVGRNASSLVPPGGTTTYTFYAEHEGSFMLRSTAANTGGEGDSGSLSDGLFGSVNVQATGARWYRSQVTKNDLDLATTGHTAAGQPIINYEAVYPAGNPRAGTPILNMLQNNEIVHTDINAVIAGSSPAGATQGRFPTGTFRSTPVNPDRDQPYREFTVMYQDEIGAVQAFPQFYDPVLEHTLHSVRDGFAINYGTGGIGAEILANRIGVGPMFTCNECKYEEFFLSSWTIGDPAMVVDIPANAPCTEDSVRNGTCTPTPGRKATKALYPDDPSNVHHAYMGDHTRFRIVHGGAKEHHIHHQHTHQWVHTPNDDNSTYLDSQALGPGSSFTLEMTYRGAGNRNEAVGDSIFHCHFYPHFAQGMWELYRVHDVFENGTQLDANGRPAAGARALPDAEILAGTPIPALVPLPGLAMAPLPAAQASIVNGQVQITGNGNPGYPFFVPAVAGHRPPHPPLDTIDDGGLPRHVITGGTSAHVETRLDFHKDLITANATAIPENGAPVEQAAMAFHAVRNHPSFTPSGSSTLPGGNAAIFLANGRPAVAGAPYADPCINDNGQAVGSPRLYKAAAIQFDIKLNKEGWHFPQQRILTLWGDVAATLNGTRPPEPFFFRANTNDCITYQHTNLVPNEYLLDDFQVRTPTDILGQHIHLVKFDVTASDGAGNGWNYEDGTFSPDEVIERINAINATGGITQFGGGPKLSLTARAHPFFGTLGAQTTVQRWYADNTLNLSGQDRTLRTVFTHDHFGPSSHQQVGLYAGLVIEPQGSVWRNPETGATLGGRFDGGPTSWHANILTANSADSYREFMIEFADFQHAYQAGGGGTAANPVPDPAKVINPPGRVEVGLPFILAKPVFCPGGVAPPCPEAIAAADVGTMVVNYRNEPVALRIRNPQTNQQATDSSGQLSGVFLSRDDLFVRADPLLRVQPNFYPPLTNGVRPTDPFTPLLRAYEGDKVQVRILVGATEEGHNFTVNGMKWLFEPSSPNSGYRNGQMMGISEHFEFVVPKLTLPNPQDSSADFLYRTGTAVDDLWNGLWGLMRIYQGVRTDLGTLPNNPNGRTPTPTNQADFSGICPRTAPSRNFDVTAVLARDALPNGRLVYNPRTNLGPNNPAGPLNDPTAILYVQTGDLDGLGRLRAGVPIEPLILRANAGDCINVTLRNRLDDPMPDRDGFNTLPMIVDNFNANQIRPSRRVGLHPQLLAYDMSGTDDSTTAIKGDGTDVGFNALQTGNIGQTITYKWYAGDVTMSGSQLVATPIEFGAANLMPADPIKQSNKGAIGAIIIEPRNSTHATDAGTRASATITPPAGGGPAFKEFVVLYQDDINLRWGNGTAVPLTAEAEDPEDSGHKAFNYRTEPMWTRLGFPPDTPLTITRTFDFTNVLSNSLLGSDPVTPIFTARVGTPVRFRVLQPGGHARDHVFAVHSHIWEEEPYANNSTVLGSNPFSEWKGAQMGHGPGNHFDALLKNGAGGKFRITGDYLYRDFPSFHFDGGLWGIFRVTP